MLFTRGYPLYVEKQLSNDMLRRHAEVLSRYLEEERSGSCGLGDFSRQLKSTSITTKGVQESEKRVVSCCNTQHQKIR